jgi:hypothetical protein
MEIKKCPFCGGEVDFIRFADYSGCFAMSGIYCENCGMFFTHEEIDWEDCDDTIEQNEKILLTEKWNRRDDDDKEK